MLNVRRFPISSAEALAAGTARRGVGIFHLEAAVLQRLDVIQFAAGDVERALGINDHAHAAALDEDVAARRAVLQIPVSYTHLRAHETGRNLVCRLLLEKK